MYVQSHPSPKMGISYNKYNELFTVHFRTIPSHPHVSRPTTPRSGSSALRASGSSPASAATGGVPIDIEMAISVYPYLYSKYMYIYIYTIYNYTYCIIYLYTDIIVIELNPVNSHVLGSFDIPKKVLFAQLIATYRNDHQICTNVPEYLMKKRMSV